MFDKSTLTRFQSLETPFYYYDLVLLRRTLQACKDASVKYDFHVHYAMKANFNTKVLDVVQSYGYGADCVSGNEVKAAIDHGFGNTKVVFAGVGKSDKEINLALDQDIFCFNAESVQELYIINDLAAAKSKIANVAVRINPNVDAHTHHFITTGLEENKFGINTWELPAVADALKTCANLQFKGIHFHIGSQITDMEVYKNLCLRVNEIQHWFEQNSLTITLLNVGGGLGVDYQNPDGNPVSNFESYFKVFKDHLDIKPHQEVHFELGRALVAQCASLVSRVLYVKNGIKKNFLILDAGMTELIRPMLYQAYHQIENLSELQVLSGELPVVGDELPVLSGELPVVGDELSVLSGELPVVDDELPSIDDAFVKKNPQPTTHNPKRITRNPQLTPRNSQLVYDVVGPICESTDRFREGVELPESKRGDLIVIRSAGAYGEVMASAYNLRDRVGSVYSE